MSVVVSLVLFCWAGAFILPVYSQDETASEEFSISRVSLEKAPEQREELSPYIQRIDLIESRDKISIFLEGWVPVDCFNEREVEISGDLKLVYIIPRFMRKDFRKECVDRPQHFAQKIYDFPKKDAIPEKVKILGYMGWYEKEIPQVGRAGSDLQKMDEGVTKGAVHLPVETAL